MSNAVVLDVGDIMEFNTGQDLLVAEAIHFNLYITLPDNTLLEKNNGDGVGITHPDGVTENPGNQYIYYRTESDVCAQDGVLKCSVKYANEFYGFSQPIPGEYVVRRRNQTV